MKNVGYRFRIDPVHGSVVNIGYLKESTHSVVSGTANTPDDLPHPPFSFDVISDVLRILDDHEGPLPGRLQVRRVWVRAWYKRSMCLCCGWQVNPPESNRFDCHAPPIFRAYGEPKWQPSNPPHNPTVDVGFGLGEV